MSDIPAEISAVILGAILTLMGFLAKKALSKIEEGQAYIREDLKRIFEFTSSLQLAGNNRENKITENCEQLENHEIRIVKIEDWTRHVSMKHNRLHPESELEII